ncbi:MAG: LpxL/LpxP family Kdo(2)-lipid IV(A) lauroyl/palmitoleoyl acyltransferase [Gammaproteobacteria bacterium]
MQPNKFTFRYLAPSFWITWILLAVMRTIILLPYSLQMSMGAWLGQLLHILASERRKIAATNIALCFPRLTQIEQKNLLHAHFISLGQGLVETALCWWGRQQQLAPLTKITGKAYLDSALNQGKGVILLSAHFTTLEIGGRLLAEHCPFQVLYRPHKNALFEWVMHNARKRRFNKAIPRKNTRALIRSLKQGNAIWYAPDQNYSGVNSLFAPFFDIPAATTSATSRLAAISGACVIPFFQMRLPDNQGYLLTLCPPLENFPSGKLLEDTTRINQLITQVVREQPEQYLWVHRRFKNRPDNKTSHYSRKHNT